MNTRKAALTFALLFIAGASAHSAPTYAAEPPAKKPPAAKAPAEPDTTGTMCGHEYGPGRGYGPGMMGGYGPGMMGGYGRGMMRGTCDEECGLDYGRGPGMMGGHGRGMMAGSPRIGLIMSLDLNDDQRSRIKKLADELEHNNWATRGMINDESAKLRDLYDADKRDPATIGKQYQKIFDLQRQMIETTIAAQNRIEDLLTPDQRVQLKKLHHRWVTRDRDYPPR